jgi:P-type conjugative transfer protein TrbL
MDPNAVLGMFRMVSEGFAGTMIPYVKDLFFLLVLVEILSIGYTHMMDGGEHPGQIVWHFVRLVLRGGVALYWIDNAWSIALYILGSFNQLGTNLTHVTSLDPVTLMNTGLKTAEVVWQAPTTGGLIPDVGLAFDHAIVWLILVLVFVLVAGLALLTISAAFVIIGPGSIFVAFWACRFTAPMAEGYPAWLVRTGVALMFFYIVLGIGQSFATQWNTGIAAACAAAPKTVPWDALAGTPTMITTMVCTQPLPSSLLINMIGAVLLFGVIAVPLPFIAASLAGHGVSLGLEHAAAGFFVARTLVSPLLRGGQALVAQAGRAAMRQGGGLARRQAVGAQAAANVRPRPAGGLNQFGVRPTTPLNNGSSGAPTSKVTRKV